MLTFSSKFLPSFTACSMSVENCLMHSRLIHFHFALSLVVLQFTPISNSKSQEHLSRCSLDKSRVCSYVVLLQKVIVHRVQLNQDVSISSQLHMILLSFTVHTKLSTIPKPCKKHLSRTNSSCDYRFHNRVSHYHKMGILQYI